MAGTCLQIHKGTTTSEYTKSKSCTDAFLWHYTYASATWHFSQWTAWTPTDIFPAVEVTLASPCPGCTTAISLSCNEPQNFGNFLLHLKLGLRLSPTPPCLDLQGSRERKYIMLEFGRVFQQLLMIIIKYHCISSNSSLLNISVG